MTKQQLADIGITLAGYHAFLLTCTLCLTTLTGVAYAVGIVGMTS